MRVYFDSFASIGKRGKIHPSEVWKREDVLAAMDRAGIAAALVVHGLAVTYDPVFGNRILLEEIAETERLYPCWVVLPPFVGDFPGPSELVQQMRDYGVLAAKIYPATYHFSLSETNVGELFAALEDAGIPLLLELAEADLLSVQRLCGRFPNLRILLQKAHWRDLRELLPIFLRCRNLYLEFSSLQNHRVVEYLVALAGAERLLFGSELPVKSAGAARALIDYAEIPDTAKDALAAGNLARLLGLQRVPAPKEGHFDELTAKAARGEPFHDELVIDAHAHVVHEGAQQAGGVVMPDASPEKQLRGYDRLGVNRIFASSYLGIWSDSAAGNAELAQVVARWPNRFVGYVTIDPTYLSDGEVLREIKTYHDELHFPGLKPYYPRNALPLTDPRYEPWWQYADAHNLFALVHFDLQKTEAEVDELAERYPNVRFLCAHSGATFDFAEMVASLAERHPNVFLELTITSVPLTVIEFLVDRVGSKRILFGTDSPMRDPRPQFGWVVYTDLDVEQKRDILGRNAARLLQGVRWG